MAPIHGMDGEGMNFNALDLNLVRVFDALMTERSATRAGARIGLSQPAVSAALVRLRHALNDQLFVRRGNEMVPTPRAEQLAELARGALSRIELMVEPQGEFDPARLTRHFTIMGSDFVSMLMMPLLTRRVREKAPAVVLRLRDTSIGDIARVLREDAVDIAIEPAHWVSEPLSRTYLYPSPFLVIAARGHPRLVDAGIRPGEAIPAELFCRLPHALRSVDGDESGLVDAALMRQGRRRYVGLTLPQFEAVARSVAQGAFVASLPSQFAEDAAGRLPLDVFRLPVQVPVPEIVMFWHPRHDADRAHRWLRQQVVACVGELGFADARGRFGGG
jgi:DNA-binding transcriptional LysR family regulator